MTVRIPRISDPTIIEALLPGARAYDYEVTHEQFDEEDNEGPGHYHGVTVSVAVAKKWDEGIAACKAASIDLRSREGLQLRYQIATGNGELPESLIAWLAKREAAQTAAANAQAAKAARLAAYAAHRSGMTDIGADEYTSAYWGITARRTLDLVANISGEDTGYGNGGNQLLRLPNGDLMEIIQGVSWTRWSTDAELIAERMARAAIRQYRYEPALCAALWDLEKIVQGCFSWFGGTAPRDNCQGAYARYGNRTASEKIQRLRQYLEAELQRPAMAAHGDKLRAALALITDTSITAE